MGRPAIPSRGPGKARTDEELLVDRAERTLAIMHRWGFAPTLNQLADELLGGRVSVEVLASRLLSAPSVRNRGGFVYLSGHDSLVSASRERVDSHFQLNGRATRVAESFARDLAKTCPLVQCVALSGSVSSGGYSKEDDIDFDLFVRSGTKYTTYLLATLVGLKYCWKFRRHKLSEDHYTPIIPRITDVNIVWPEDQTQPFIRQDASMAFELLHCRPLMGQRRFQRMLDDNDWIRHYFPQVYENHWLEEENVEPNAIGRFLLSLASRPKFRRSLERASRGLVWVLYQFVQQLREGIPGARERIEFVRRVKFPYEVFQD